MRTTETREAREAREAGGLARLAHLAPLIAAELTKRLGTVWTVAKRDEYDVSNRSWCLVADTPERHALYLRTGYQEHYQRMAVCGSTSLACCRTAKGERPALYRADPQAPSITVALTKDAAVIARDICTRVLPQYLACVRCLVDKVRAADAADAAKDRALSYLARATRGTRCGGRHTKDGITCAGADLDVYGVERVDVLLSDLTAEQAADVVAYAQVVRAHGKAAA